jgi:hypothetical protein
MREREREVAAPAEAKRGLAPPETAAAVVQAPTVAPVEALPRPVPPTMPQPMGLPEIDRASVLPVELPRSPTPAPAVVRSVEAVATPAAPDARPAAAAVSRVDPADSAVRRASAEQPAMAAEAMPAVQPVAGTAATADGLSGAVDAGARRGHDVATPLSLPASAPRLNLELARPRGGEISRQGPGGMLQLLPHPPDVKSKLARDIEKAARPDCRTAYAGLGLLAVVPLAVDAARSKGCGW